MSRVLVARRALLDLDGIRRYSEDTWSPTVARRYLDDLQAALGRLAEHPGLLQQKGSNPSPLHLHRVREHLLVCTVIDDVLYLVAVQHGSMDLPSRLAELEPTLLAEVRLMHQRVVDRDKDR